MASEECNKCKEGRNCINGRYCLPERKYVEHQNEMSCAKEKEIQNRGGA